MPAHVGILENLVIIWISASAGMTDRNKEYKLATFCEAAGG
jgi:hypothetical protein